MKKYYLLLIFLILIINNVYAYDKITEYDDNDEIIYTTTVYKDGQVYTQSICNLTIFNPYPNENYINRSFLLDNKGNGIYSYNLTGILSYNKNPYPISVTCNDTFGNYGAEERIAIKIGESLFDYTSAGILLLGLSIALLFASFKIDKENYVIRNLSFFGSFAFFIATLFYGLFIINKIPGNEGFIAVFEVAITVLLVLIMVFVWMFFKGNLERLLSNLTGTNRKKK